MHTLTPDSDGYTDGVRGRALVLDMFAEWDRAGTCNSAWDHPATKLANDEVNAACDSLVKDGLLVPDWLTQPDGISNLTPAGQAAHSAAQRIRSDLVTGVAAADARANVEAAERKRAEARQSKVVG